MAIRVCFGREMTAIVAIIAGGFLAGERAAASESIEVRSREANERTALWLTSGENPRCGFYASGKLTAKLNIDGEETVGELLHESLEGTTQRYELRYNAKTGRLAIDGKAVDAAFPRGESPDGAEALAAVGKALWFIATTFGRIAPSDRWSSPPAAEDLSPTKRFSFAWYLDRDLELAETYRYNLELDALEDWSIAWDERHPISHSDGARVARLRLFADGRLVGARSPDQKLFRRRVSPDLAAALISDLVTMAGDAKAGSVETGDAASSWGVASSWSAALWDQRQELVRIAHEGQIRLIHVVEPSAKGGPGSAPLGWKEMRGRLGALLHEPMASYSEARAAVEGKLDEKVDIDIGPLELIFALDALERQGGVKITVDLARLKEKGVTQNAKVEVSSRGKPLREAFDRLLKQVDLEYEVTDEGVFVPAREPAAE